MRPFVFIQLSTRRAPTTGVERLDKVYCNTARFYGKPGGVVEPYKGRRADAERRAKLKMSIKSIKSEAQGRLPWNILRQRGNSFSYAISISCFASSRLGYLPPSPRRRARVLPTCFSRTATNLRSIRVSSLKTVNSARHQGECELAPVVLSARR